MRKGGGGDPEIMCADELAVRCQLRPRVGVNARDLLGDFDRTHPSEHMLDECTPTRTLRSARSIDAVKELADRDDTDRTVFLTDRVLDLRISDAALEVDKHVGIDQDGHASSGGPTDSRAARTSSRKPSSGDGAVAISSRNRSGESNRDFGGEITATAEPLLTTSISSPRATLLSTSEKLRAASVAVIRVMGEESIR